MVFMIASRSSMFMIGHTRSSSIPGAFSMMMYSAPIGLSSVLELQAKTLGIGVPRTVRAYSEPVKLFSVLILGVRNTKSIVATSLAVVKWAKPAFGFGTLATTWAPLSMERSMLLLYMPSGNFSIPTQVFAPTVSAAQRASSFTLNRTRRCDISNSSSQMKRPLVNSNRESLYSRSDEVSNW